MYNSVVSDGIFVGTVVREDLEHLTTVPAHLQGAGQ